MDTDKTETEEEIEITDEPEESEPEPTPEQGHNPVDPSGASSLPDPPPVSPQG